ncbi:microsomal signal peptidase [Laetiporus sulphureus 93-53]|uniref:Signal peptidase complex subunit 1 n=1 Tax=Laetiporus sulphureus 93-53 TaxID=1314785 RepID=A0A165C0D0_9APHY|nr:microsomal signal peptidase [Laetiporus sulphureus 93-53]KZT01971.1 microsomal signal peptidase [Laetiporus sulphureus 93-53]
MDSLQKIFEGRIDFEGQKSVEQITRITLIGATIVSFILGFALQSLRVTFSTFGLAAIALFLVVLPPWPMFNRHPVKFLSPKEKKR